MCLRLLLVVALVLALRLPFLDQAIQGDDVNYLAGAQHAQIDPLHPNHARYPFLGQVVDMRGHPHPPLNTWVLALLLALMGDVYEVPYHAVYIVFSLVAALAMWSLARRFSPRPLTATLLFLAVPAFVVNGNSLEADLPLLACWMAAVALFVKAVDLRSARWLAVAAVPLALAGLAAYQAVLIVPVLWLYLWWRAREWRPAWLVAATPLLMLGLWQCYERLSTGALPASVLAGYLHGYGFQAFTRKIANAAALVGHAGWMIFPALTAAAFWKSRPWPRTAEPMLLAAAVPGALLDPHPLYWIGFGVGATTLVWLAVEVQVPRDAKSRFLAAWFLIFFGGALVVFFAGSARYLLPIAAPLALLVSNALADRPRWLFAGLAAQLLLSLSLSVVNYQHWDGYRRFAHSLAGQTADKRVWINGEWGLRFYLEAQGGLPLLRGQAVQPGDVVVSSQLALPLEFTTGGGARAPLAEQQIRARLPLRLVGLGARSAYSSAAAGPRPFDLSLGPIDIVRAEAILERPPALSLLTMSAPEAENQIVSGIHQLESGRWRWMGDRAVLLLKAPPAPAPLRVTLFIPDQAPARRVTLSVDGRTVAEQLYPRPGSYTLVSAPLALSGPTATVTLTVDKTFSVPGDHRRLGLILSEVGF
ncbi:MAG: glycosyltransferase family 39 protein [Acidobacteria bacterium]|nr:glycosyltransferase family 39 protein [Acidobacteriota bacterium]